MERPALDSHLDSKVFREFYYLKEELIDFCRKNNLSTSGGKLEVADRIICFFDTGKIVPISTVKKKAIVNSVIYEDTKIEDNFICTEKHRAFFKEKIGSSFSFNVVFQKWLKNNGGKTYKEAIVVYL